MSCILMLAATSCQTAPTPTLESAVTSTSGKLLALHHQPDHQARAEADKLASIAESEARRLARLYRVQSPAWVHNCLVNVGIKERGLCWQYMEDLFVALNKSQPVRFDLHSGVRDDGSTFFEHNCVVVTAAGQPFTTGLVLDPWHKPGQLLVFPARGHGKPWFEQAGYTHELKRSLETRE